MQFFQYIDAVLVTKNIRKSNEGVLLKNFDADIFLTILIMVTEQLY